MHAQFDRPTIVQPKAQHAQISPLSQTPFSTLQALQGSGTALEEMRHLPSCKRCACPTATGMDRPAEGEAGRTVARNSEKHHKQGWSRHDGPASVTGGLPVNGEPRDRTASRES